MAKEKQLTLFLQKCENDELKDDMLVHITIHNVPASLVKEFTQEVVRQFYPRGISDAIQDLMRKAVEEQKQGKLS